MATLGLLLALGGSWVLTILPLGLCSVNGIQRIAEAPHPRGTEQAGCCSGGSSFPHQEQGVCGPLYAGSHKIQSRYKLMSWGKSPATESLWAVHSQKSGARGKADEFTSCVFPRCGKNEMFSHTLQTQATVGEGLSCV